MAGRRKAQGTGRSSAFACLLCSVLVGSARAQFVETEIVFGQPIDGYMSLPAGDGGPGAILLTGRAEGGRKRVGIYSVLASGRVADTPSAELALPDDVLFFDTGVVGGEPSLMFLGTDGVWSLDARTEKLRRVLEVASIYRAPSGAALTRLDFAMDVNDDGLEDLVVPGFEGVRVSTQSGDGFGEPALLNVSPRMTIASEQARYSADELHRYDFDFDGKRDLAVVRDNRFLVFDALSDSGFASEPRVVPIDLSLADDEELARFERNLVEIDQSDFEVTRIARIIDLNRDGLPDIVTFTAISTGVFEKRSEYHVHLARRRGTSIVFSDEADAAIPSSGFQFGLTPVDVDNDGRRDLVTSSVEFGFRQLIAALLTRRLKLDVNLYRFGAPSVYPAEPDYTADVRLKFDISSGFVSNPAVRFGDFNGDGAADLLLQDGVEELEIRTGSASGESFGGESWTWETRLPLDGTQVEVADVDGDGCQDVLVAYGSGDGEEMLDRLRVLVSRPSPDAESAARSD